MTIGIERPVRPAVTGPETRAADRPDLGLLAGVVGLIGSAVFIPLLPPISDHAYQFYMADRVLRGATLYVDIGAADMHPPLFTWLAMAVTMVARPIGTSPLTLYMILVTLAVLGCAWAFWRAIGGEGWLLAVLGFALLAMAGPFAGQGEHLAVVLALPWLATAAAESNGRPVSRTAAILAGIVAGIGLAMKPHFALVWIGVECWLAWRNGTRSLLRASSVAIAVVFTMYVILTAALTPIVFSLVQWVAPLYARFAPASILDMLIDTRMLLVAAGLGAGLIGLPRDHRHAPIARILAIAVAAMTLALLLQRKGWGYHWYPATALSAILIGFAVHARLAGRFRAAATVVVAALAVGGASMQVDRTMRLLAGEPVLLPGMMEAVETHTARGESIVALSYALQTGFPLVTVTGAEWASPYAHLWMVPALYADVFAGRAPVRYRDVGQWRSVEQQMFDRLWAAIEQENPALLIVQAPFRNGFDMRAYFETDHRFRERFAASPVLDTVGGYILLGRPTTR